MRKTKDSHFIHQLSYSVRERLVGLFVLVALILLAAQAVVSSQATQLFESKRLYHILLNNPLGVGDDTKVRISGLDVGWVTQVNLTEQNTFAITIAVYEKFHKLIRQDSVASVSKLAVVGDSIINISPGSINLATLESDSEIAAVEDMSIDDMLTQLQPVLDQAQISARHFSDFIESLPTDQIPEIFNRISTITDNIALLSESLLEGDSSASQLITDDKVITELLTTLKQVQSTIDQSQHVLKDTQATIQQLPALIENSQTLITNTNEQLNQIPALLNSTLQLVGDTQTIVDTVSGMWPLAENMPAPSNDGETLETLPAN